MSRAKHETPNLLLVEPESRCYITSHQQIATAEKYAVVLFATSARGRKARQTTPNQGSSIRDFMY